MRNYQLLKGDVELNCVKTDLSANICLTSIKTKEYLQTPYPHCILYSLSNIRFHIA